MIGIGWAEIAILGGVCFIVVVVVVAGIVGLIWFLANKNKNQNDSQPKGGD